MQQKKNLPQLKSLTIFFPFYNDEGTVEYQIDCAYKYGTLLTNDLEVIAIHGGPSKDETLKKIHSMKSKYPSLKIVDKTNNEIGYAVIKYGFAESTKEWVFYTDGDAQYHLDELTKLVSALQESGSDVANGYKIHRKDNIFRIVFGNFYKEISRRLFKLPIKDTDCDFRLIRGELVRRIDFMSTNSAILPELIVKLSQMNAKFIEVPVSHYARVYGKSSYNVWSLMKEKAVGDLKLHRSLRKSQ